MNEPPEPPEPDPEPAQPADEDPPAQESADDSAQQKKATGKQWSSRREVEAEETYSSATTVTVVMGDVNGESVAVGTVGAPQRGRIINAALSEFATVTRRKGVYAPDALAAAQSQLGRDRLLVLVGPSDSGKQFAALCLLGRLGHKQALGISPAADAQLVTTRITEKEAAYVIGGSQMFGRTGAGASSGTARHDMDVLARRLRTNDAYLVATVHAEISLAASLPYAFPWTMPDPVELFEHLWKHGQPSDHAVDPKEIAEVVKELTQEGMLTPRLTTRMVSLLRDGADPASARDDIRESSGTAATDQVRKWFAEDRTFDQVLYLTVAAFLGGLDESTLEWHYEDIRRRFDRVPSGPDAEDDASTPRLPPPPEPSRHGRVITDLLRLSEPGETLIPDRTIDLVSEAYRQAAVKEIWTSWGRDFWGPVTAWLAALPTDLSVGGADRLARGLACLATCTYSEVLRMLDRWWDRSPLERRCAVRTVSELATDGRLAAAVLHTTIWLGRERNATLERWWTTDIALGGPLGVAFWPVAVPELWERIKTETADGPAGLALWNLLAGEQASEQLATIILGFLWEQVEGAETPSERRAVLATVMAVLGTRFERDDKVARAAAVLGGLPEPRRYLVALLRAALRHHTSAVRPLATGMLRHARAVGSRAEMVSLLEEAASSQDPDIHKRQLWPLRGIVKTVLHGQDLDDEDAVLREAFSGEPPDTAEDTDKEDKEQPEGGLDDE